MPVSSQAIPRPRISRCRRPRRRYSLFTSVISYSPRAEGGVAAMASRICGWKAYAPTMAHELGGSNIRTNAIAPGPTDTSATREVVPEMFLEPLVQSLMIKRLGTPDDLVGACLFLLSDEARWMTGQIIAVDGGQTIRI